MAVMSVVFVAGCKSKFAIYILLRNNAVRNQTAARLLRSQKGDLRVMTTKVLWAHACLNCSKKHNTPGNQTMLIGKPKLSLTILATALIAAGCGGGGSSTSDNTAQAGGTTVSGVAAKGLIHGGRVQLFAFDAKTDKLVAAPVSTVKTGADGGYSADIGNATGAFLIQVDAVEGTTMGDEATGEELPMPTTLKLRSAFEFDTTAGKAVAAHVSPFTEMIVITAENAPGGLTKANREKAKAAISVLLGFDPTKVKPVASNSDNAANATEEEKIQSLSLATLSKLAKDNAFGCIGAPAEKIACVVNRFTTSATLNGDSLEVNQTVRDTFRAALIEVTNDKTINKTGKDSSEGLPPLVPQVVTITPVVSDPVDAAKLMFADLRSNFNALALADGKAILNARTDALKQDFKSATTPLDRELVDWVRISARGISYFEAYKAGRVTSPSVDFYDASNTWMSNGALGLTTPFVPGATWVGSCEAYADADYTVVATTPAEAIAIGCGAAFHTVANSFRSIDANHYSIQRYSKKIGLTPVVGKPDTYTYTTRARLDTVTFVKGSNGAYTAQPVPLANRTTIGTYDSQNNVGAGNITFTKTGNNLTSLTIVGAMPARTDDTGAALTDHELVNLTASQEIEEAGVMKYNIAGDITAIKGGAPVGKVSLKPGTFVRLGQRSSSDINGDLAFDTVKSINLAFSAEQATSKVEGVLTLNGFMADASGNSVQPTSAKFTGSLTNANAEFFSGTVGLERTNYASFDNSKPESASNFLKENASFVGSFTIPQRPTLTVALSAATEAYQYVTFNGSYIGAAGFLGLSLSGGNTHGPKLFALRTGSGISGSFNDDADSADLVKDGSVIAKLNRKTGMIAYRDGTFESLK
jgi:hypothetical protein